MKQYYADVEFVPLTPSTWDYRIISVFRVTGLAQFYGGGDWDIE